MFNVKPTAEELQSSMHISCLSSSQARECLALSREIDPRNHHRSNLMLAESQLPLACTHYGRREEQQFHHFEESHGEAIRLNLGF